MEPIILAIDTSCDETSAAVTCGHRILSNVISSQIDLHRKYGGVYPVLAKRAHEERIDFVIKEALKRAFRTLKLEDRSERLEMKCEVGKEKNQKITLPTSNSSFPFLTSHIPLSAVAVTQGPGLAIALEVGIKKAKELINNLKWENRSGRLDKEIGSRKIKNQKIPLLTSISSFSLLTSHLPLIAVNHLEGHIYSCLAETGGKLKWEDGSERLDKEIGSRKIKNQKIPHLTSISSFQHPTSHLQFPALCLIVSGGHTELVLMKDHGKYEVVGETLDDACGEALDKAAKILKLGYPGGPIIERLAADCFSGLQPAPKNDGRRLKSAITLTPPLKEKNNLNFSYSGLKTQFLYLVQKMAEEEFSQNLHQLAFSFQSACFEQIIRKTSYAIRKYQPKTLITGGGVIANKYLRKLLRRLGREYNIPVLFPPKKNLITDNAAMIGIAAYHKYLRNEFIKDIESLDREPRLCL